MSICPKGKMSKSKRDKRKAQSWQISAPSLVYCSRCGELMKAHRVCKSCGTYNNREVIAVD
ncbi:MAG: 50S ribosomal protein L32 [Firmicutes bacterium]|jgi:large subunit ribosomal protein L32|nr:50S ribosomal protein L32 [Bacillota bacterium]